MNGWAVLRRRDIAVLVSVLTMAAALAAQCPVEIRKLTEAPVGSMNKTTFAAAIIGNPNVGHVGIYYQNQSDKDVLTVRFGLGYVNTMRELSYVEFVDTQEHRVKPGKSFGLLASTGNWNLGDQTKHVAWVEKVMFSDGTFWNDDGSKSCATASLQNAFIADGKMSPQQMLAFSQSGEGSMTVVSTYPTGAAVSVDGKTVGVTPLTFMLLRHGSTERIITLTLAGYKPQVEHRMPNGSMIVITSRLEPDQAATSEAKPAYNPALPAPPSTSQVLAPVSEPTKTATSAKVLVVSTPDAAEIEMDGSFVGSTPSTIEVSSGDHTVTLRKSGYKSWTRKIKVTGGEVKISAGLERNNPSVIDLH